MKLTILIADDDEVFRDLLQDILAKQNYEILQAADGQEAMDLFFEKCPGIDLVILDVMMPKADGWEVLKTIREYSDVPVLMLTALGDEAYELLGLQNGADDYVTKPFGYEILTARVNALLRKVKRERSMDLQIGDLRVCQLEHKVFVFEEEIVLNNKEYQLLLYLIHNKNLVLERETILSRVWGYDFDKDIRTIDTHIKMLRAKLTGCGGYIQTVRGTGYRFGVDE